MDANTPSPLQYVPQPAAAYPVQPPRPIPIGALLCRNCGYAGVGRLPGNGFVEFILWFCYIVPGLIYSIWRRSTGRNVCPVCRAPHMIPCWNSGSSGAMVVAPVAPVEPPKPLGTRTKVGLSVTAFGVVLLVVVAGTVSDRFRQVKAKAEEAVRAEETSREIAYMDAQSKLTKQHPWSAQKIRATYMQPADVPGHFTHEGWVTQSGGIYYVNIPVGNVVYHCEGPPNGQKCGDQ
jgi:hypothetical protein